MEKLITRPIPDRRHVNSKLDFRTYPHHTIDTTNYLASDFDLYPRSETEEMKSRLTNEFGIVFPEPSRVAIVAVPHRGPLVERVVLEKIDDMLDWSSWLVEALETQPALDSFATHDERVDWRQKMYQQYGDSFWRFWQSNKITSGAISHIDGGVTNISDDLMRSGVDTSLAQQLYKRAEETRNLTDQYGKKTLDEKLAIVRAYDDLAIETLNAVYGSDIVRIMHTT